MSNIKLETLIATIERLVREGNPNHKMLGELLLEAEEHGVPDEVIENLLCRVRKQK
jgi:hypothetical protein